MIDVRGALSRIYPAPRKSKCITQGCTDLTEIGMFCPTCDKKIADAVKATNRPLGTNVNNPQTSG